tara:strand:- start:49 stop:300 length:252 start_codon:yes stop_codon:yes gene_type:complete
MKTLWKAVKREFDLWKKRRAYFKRLEKEFEEKKEELPPVYNIYPHRIFSTDDIHPSVRALYFEKDGSLMLKGVFQLNTKHNTH